MDCDTNSNSLYLFIIYFVCYLAISPPFLVLRNTQIRVLFQELGNVNFFQRTWKQQQAEISFLISSLITHLCLSQLNTSRHRTGSQSNLGWKGSLDVAPSKPLLKAGLLDQVFQGNFLSILYFFPFSPLIQPHPPSSCL